MTTFDNYEHLLSKASTPNSDRCLLSVAQVPPEKLNSLLSSLDNLLRLHTATLSFFFESAHQEVSSSLKLKHDINHQNVFNDALIRIPEYVLFVYYIRHSLPIFISKNQDAFPFFFLLSIYT